ncbi:protein kinase [bacterium]|nr:protein kinase [bacterium]
MIGNTILHYKILEKLGEGGMGVVYKAEDTKLKREVALKFLPTNALQGSDEKDRFLREAQAAAAFSHTNIAHIYAIEEFDGQMFIVMEFIEGKSLEEIVGVNGGTPMPLNQAINYATQIAAGLQAAQEKGVTHRDVKSSNIMVTDKDVVKIMDFGLAKLAHRSKMTVQGATLGTAAYMSPEQARGEVVDHRADIWSLGVVLYEMISGQLPFKGEYEQAVIYSILNEEPEPLTAVRSGLPIALDGIIAKALAKDPDIRYQHVDELPADLKALDTAAISRSGISVVQSTSGRSESRKGTSLPWIIAAISLVALALALAFMFVSKKPAERENLRLNLSAVTSQEQALLRTEVPALALSPDGNTLVYTVTAGGQSQLYLRSLTDFEAVPIDGTENARAPFFSPDGQWIGFLAEGRIKKLSLLGGVVETVSDAPGFRGTSWGPDNTIVFSPQFNSGLMAISATGGPSRQITFLDTTQQERTHRWPQVLPDGKWVLYTIGDLNSPNSYVNARLAMQSLETGVRHILDVRGEMARYIEPGFIIVARNGNLLAAPFSLKDFKTTQPLLPVLDQVDGDGASGVAHFDISKSGRLIYLAGLRNEEGELVWVDRQGKVEPLPLPVGGYHTPRISPDGTRLTVGVVKARQGNNWIYNFKTGVFRQNTFVEGLGASVWSPDGKTIYLSGTRALWMKPTDGSAAATRLFSEGAGDPLFPSDITPDATKLLFNRMTVPGAGRLAVLDLRNPSETVELFAPGVLASSGNLSPDGRFLVYGSTETGRPQIFVTSFPDLSGKWQVSSDGGLFSIWSPDGKELYYLSPLGRMMAVPISRDPVFSAGKPEELFDASQMSVNNSPGANYDISRDGKRFIMMRNAQENRGPQAFNLILNWTDELQDRFRENN